MENMKNNDMIVSIKKGSPYSMVYSRPGSLHPKYVPDLITQTVHPDDIEANFIFSFHSPDVSRSDTFTYQEAYESIYNNILHQHDFFELIYVVRGEMYQWIENERHLYPEGSLCLLNLNTCHQEEYSTDYQALFLALPTEFIRSLLDDTETFFYKVEQKLKGRLHESFFRENINGNNEHKYIDFMPKSSNPDIKKKMHDLFTQLTFHFVNPTIGSTYTIKSIILQIFYELSLPSSYETIPLSIKADPETNLCEAIGHLIMQSHGKISRKELENELNYSGDHLNRIIKKHMGISLVQYKQQLKLQEVENLLKNTDFSVNHICKLLNFNNQTAFYKLFQSVYGLTPNEFRNRCQTEKK